MQLKACHKMPSGLLLVFAGQLRLVFICFMLDELFFSFSLNIMCVNCFTLKRAYVVNKLIFKSTDTLLKIIHVVLMQVLVYSYAVRFIHFEKREYCNSEFTDIFKQIFLFGTRNQIQSLILIFTCCTNLLFCST